MPQSREITRALDGISILTSGLVGLPEILLEPLVPEHRLLGLRVSRSAYIGEFCLRGLYSSKLNRESRILEFMSSKLVLSYPV
jgi:hypothetical protein